LSEASNSALPRCFNLSLRERIRSLLLDDGTDPLYFSEASNSSLLDFESDRPFNLSLRECIRSLLWDVELRFDDDRSVGDSALLVEVEASSAASASASSSSSEVAARASNSDIDSSCELLLKPGTEFSDIRFRRRLPSFGVEFFESDISPPDESTSPSPQDLSETETVRSVASISFPSWMSNLSDDSGDCTSFIARLYGVGLVAFVGLAVFSRWRL
jgi:hypothetical protein